MTANPVNEVPSRDPAEQPTGLLTGTRIVDFCWAGVGANATRVLADLGAQVIKVESRDRLDVTRKLPIYKGEPPRSYGNESSAPDPNRGGYFNNCNRNKLGITVDMKKPAGKALVERLIRVSDVVTENFAPGVMERWGFDYEHLRALVPDIILGRMSGYGHTGPRAGYKSYGPVVQATSGLSYISGLPGREPSGWGFSYMDSQAAFYNAAGLLMAIYRRMRTGQGGEVSCAANEAGVHLLGPVLLDVSINGNTTRRPDFPTGNRLEFRDAAPHGVYPCRADDRWIAISVFGDDHWRGLVKAMDDPLWARELGFATQADRHANQDALDEHLSRWTSARDHHELTVLLQEHGVPAGAVQNARDVNEWDQQLAERGVFFELDHPVAGRARFEGVPFLMSGETEPVHWRSGPLLGEDNAFVFKSILGLDEDEFDALVAEGAIQEEVG
jgi:crotonobetainyl-CoA:carnitine CoA-transferase CaiB-like acyl-CoA transferase